MTAQPCSTPTFSSFNPYRKPSISTSYERLREMDLFSGLPDRDLMKLTSAGHERRVGKGNIILCQNEPDGHHLFVILDGEATVSWENADGFESALTTLRCGDMVGEIELFNPGSRCTTVRALSPMKLLALHRDDLLRGLREKPELALGFLSEMARRLVQSTAVWPVFATNGFRDGWPPSSSACSTNAACA